MDSILTSIKKLLGVTEEDNAFDDELIMLINGVFMNLTQIGIGPSDGFVIKDAKDTWNDFTHDTPNFRVEWVQTYIHLQVKLVFDPPTGSVLDSYKRRIDELECRLNLAAECSE